MVHRLYGPGMISGNYPITGDPAAADIISMHEWGPLEPIHGTTRLDPGNVNRELAEMALGFRDQRRRPIVGTEAIHAALLEVSGGSIGVDYAVEGESSNLTGGGVGTSGEVRRTKRAMDEDGLELPLFLAQANHVGRVAVLHARKEKIYNYVIPDGLPRGFRPESSQPWIQSKGLWVVRELIGAPVLWATGRI